MKIIRKKLIFVFALASFFAVQCTYHNVEDQFSNITTGCDTIEVSYSQQLLPLLQANCISCHNQGNPSDGIKLDSYNNLTQAAGSGRLLGALQHQSGYAAMPQGAPKLSDCEIAAFEAWINQGFKNN